MKDIKLEFYVLRYNINKKEVENFNIFNNGSLYNRIIDQIKKYLKSPEEYYCEQYDFDSGKYVKFSGFDGFCKELDSSIQWQEWGRVEYEISVGDPFPKSIDELEKWDCYMQAKPNVPMIAREILYQYQEQTKKKRTRKKKEVIKDE